MSDRETKRAWVREFMQTHALDALLLRRVSSFAWYTGGASSYVNTASDFGAASLLITDSGDYVLTNNIEATRLEDEERLAEQGFDVIAPPWYASADPAVELTRGLRLGADVAFPGAQDLSTEFGRLRARLSPEDGLRFQQLGRLCAEAMDAAIHRIRPGQTEFEIAAMLGQESQVRGAQPTVNLIATDERIFRFRHPLPTDKKLERQALVILCGRKWGLVCSVTRLVYFGRLPDELRRKQEACAHIDATFIANTRPGARLGDVFARAVATYKETGYPDEWQLHHQGGSAGYEPREHIATPDSQEIVLKGQAFAWNPSITGAKSEDTVLVGAHANEILTAIPGWPSIEVHVGNAVLARPAMLEFNG
jgi:Xaa-Pro aminopeptidase